jgi:O-antigen ligase
MNGIMIFIFFAGFFALTWRKIYYGVLFTVFALPLYVMRFSVMGLPSTLLEGMVLIVFLIWMIKRLGEILEIWKKQPITLEYTIFIGIVLLFFFASIVSVFVAPHAYAALGLWRAYILEPLLFFVVFVDTIREKKQILFVYTATILSGSSIALYGIFQKITGFGVPEPWALERRITSIYPYPNAVGLYLAPIIILCSALLAWCLQKPRTGSLKKQSMCGALIGMLALLLTALYFAKTEAAFVALAVSGALFGFFWSNASRRSTITVCVFVLFFIAISPPLRNTMQEKLFLHDWSGIVRKSIWKETIPMVRDNWIGGAGFAGYPEKMKAYHKDTFTEIFQYPHTLVLNFWSEMGLVGLIAFELLVGWYFFLLARILFILQKIPQGDKKIVLRTLAFGGICAMSTIVIHGFVDVPYFKNDLSVFFWVLIGMGITLYSIVQKISLSTEK